MLLSIASAKKSIYLEMYIFENDTKGYDFLSVLEQKAREGVRVVVILDAIGGYWFRHDMIARLRKSGTEVLFFSYWFRRLHRKVLIVDEVTAFLGGVNISGRYARWNDLHVRIHGKVVRSVLRSFVHVYQECGGKNEHIKNSVRDGDYRTPVLTKARLWFVEHGIGKKRYTLRAHYEKYIDEAKKSIVLITPYLVPHRWLIAHLHQAILRGVTVEIIMPEHTDYWMSDRINNYYLSLFTKLGAKCFLSKEMNHAKAMLIDERVGTVGSHNLDSLSFEWNAEASVFFDNPGMVSELARILEKWKKTAVSFTSQRHPAQFFDTTLAFVLRIL